jgi:chloramphenicol 3-O phosphotransferase
MVNELGQIVILNGVPRSGKSSIVKVIQEEFDGAWMNLGVDWYKRCVTPQKYSPSIGLRPGAEALHLEPFVVAAYRALYESIAAHSRAGLNVVVDVGHHDSYSRPLGILERSAKMLTGLPVLFVGVQCPVEEIVERRRKTWNLQWEPGDPIPEPVLRWQREVHRPGIYDVEVDTSVLTPEECAGIIRERLHRDERPTAFDRIAGMA